MSATPNEYFSKVNKVRDLTRQFKKGKNVKESLQLLILLSAPSKAYAVAGTKKYLIRYFQSGAEEIELAEQLMHKIIRLEKEFEKKMADLPVKPVESSEPPRKRKASTASTSSNGTSNSESTTASEPKKAKVEAAAPAPVKKPQEPKITADEKMREFIARQQAKKLERLQATRTTKVLSVEQSKKQLAKVLKRGRRGF